MKILHLTHTYFPAVGGAQSLTRLIAEEMHRLGNESIIFTANARRFDEFHQFKLQQPLPKEESIYGVNVHRFELNKWLGIFYSPVMNKIRGGWRLQSIFAGSNLDYLQHGPVLKGYVNAIGRLKPDIMLAITSFPWTTYAASVAKKRYKIPFVLIPSTHTAHSWAYTDCLKELYKSVDCVVASTEFERIHLIKQGVTDKKIIVVTHAIDQKLLEGPRDYSIREKFDIQKNQPVIIYVGRKVKYKGIEELIRAMHIIWQSYPEAYLILAGKVFDNFDINVLDNFFKEVPKKHKKQIINISDFKDSEMKQIYDAADIFAMPSNIDSFGLVYLEAWARQLPVIACKNTPQESFIEHDKTGYLVDYGNVESLANGIKYLLDNKEIRINIGENGYQQLLKEHTVETYGQNLLNIYKNLLK